MLSARRLPVLVGAALLSMSCQLVFGLGEYESAGESESPGTTGSGGSGGAAGGTSGGGLGPGMGGSAGAGSCTCQPVAQEGWARIDVGAKRPGRERRVNRRVRAG